MMNMHRAQLQSQLLAQRNQHIQQADGICSPGKSDYDIFILRDHMIPLHIEKNFFRQIHPAVSFFPLCLRQPLLFLCADKLECPRWRALCTLVRGIRKPIAAFGSPCFSFVPLHYTSDVCPVKLLILYPLSPVLRFSRFP